MYLVNMLPKSSTINSLLQASLQICALIAISCVGLLNISCGIFETTFQRTPEPIPVPLTSTAKIDENNSLLVHISGEINSPGNVYVEYWSTDTPRLRSKTYESLGTTYTAHATRLKQSTQYSYQVFGINKDGEYAPGPKGLFNTGILPEGLSNAEFRVIQGQFTQELIFMEFRQHEFVGLVAFNKTGDVVWYFQPPDGEQPYVMSQRPNGNIVYLAGYKGGTTALGIVEIEPIGNEIARHLDDCQGYGPIHHEIQILPDGNVMYLSRDILWSGITERPFPQEGDTIGIWNPVTGSAKIVWNIFDFISPIDRVEPISNYRLPGHPLWGGCERDRSVEDWSHGNSASMDSDGNIIVSLGHLNQIISIAPDYKSLNWRLGGPGSDFSFTSHRDRFYAQHTAIPLENGNVLLFDNGNRRPESEGGQFSRAQELSLDMDNKVASTVWEYSHPAKLFSICCSSVERLDNGNTLVMFGSDFADICCRIFVIGEVDQDGRVVWEVHHTSPGKPNQYRVYASNSIMGEYEVQPSID